MLSRSPDQPLNTAQVRMESLATHLDHRVWEPTPYISFTKSASAIEDLAARRSRNRSNQTLTVINPVAQLRDGLPILDVAAEMDHYGIPDPYNNGMIYYINHYACLWEVTRAEIIHHYEWEELSKDANWYEKEILPAFAESNVAFNIPRVSTFNMSAMINTLPGKSLANAGHEVTNFQSHEQLYKHRYGVFRRLKWVF